MRDASIADDNGGDPYLWVDMSLEAYMTQFECLQQWAQNQNMSAQIEPGFKIDSRELPPSRTKTSRMIGQLSSTWAPGASASRLPPDHLGSIR